MKQTSLTAVSGFELKSKATRKRIFLAEMEQVVPWAALVALITPHAPARGAKGGRPPFASKLGVIQVGDVQVLRQRLARAGAPCRFVWNATRGRVTAGLDDWRAHGHAMGGRRPVRLTKACRHKVLVRQAFIQYVRSDAGIKAKPFGWPTASLDTSIRPPRIHLTRPRHTPFSTQNDEGPVRAMSFSIGVDREKF